MEELPREIILRWDKENGIWKVFATNGQPILENVKDFIKENYKEDDLFDDYDTLRKTRTKINNKNKELAKARKQACNVMIADIRNSLMECEKMLEFVSDDLTAKMEKCQKEEI